MLPQVIDLRMNVIVMGSILKRIGIGNPEVQADTLSTKLLCTIFLMMNAEIILSLKTRI